MADRYQPSGGKQPLKRILLTYRDGFTTEEYSYIANAGVIHVPMPAFGAMILYHKCDDTVSEK